MSKQDFDSAHVRIRPMKQEGVEAIPVIDDTYFAASQPEHCRARLGLATKGAGINASSVAEARTAILQAECKR